MLSTWSSKIPAADAFSAPNNFPAAAAFSAGSLILSNPPFNISNADARPPPSSADVVNAVPNCLYESPTDSKTFFCSPPPSINLPITFLSATPASLPTLPPTARP